MIKFEEFNLFSQSDNEWIAIFEKIITDYGIERTLVLEIGAITGLHTQHIMVETIEKADLRTQQLICHKLNVKMGGLNVIVNFGTNV
uniref:Uncharacterized protein n=1 Tax=Panagrolaimus superbus TaxID=310955 RepID=A0A914Y220_9BILA